ncbi:MAG: hypothetical protein OXC03_03500 [Flavobacteriaceae bacterium]|nr:hypothetical protein [Flavobacteriaceae bacterium]
MNQEVLEIDLHGLSHKQCIERTEDFLLNNCNTEGVYEFCIITGNSKKLQQLLIHHVLEKHGFTKYYVLERNRGRLFVHNVL